MRSRSASTVPGTSTGSPRCCSARSVLVQRLEDRKIGGRAGVAGIRREVEQHDGDLALGARGCGAARPAWRRAPPASPPARACGPCRVGASPSAVARAAAEHHRPVAPSSSGIATIIVASTGSRPRAIGLPLLERLELDRVRGEVRHVERSQHLFGGLRVVVGRAADQREAGQRDDGVDRAAPSLRKYARSPGARRVRWRRPG